MSRRGVRRVPLVSLTVAVFGTRGSVTVDLSFPALAKNVKTAVGKELQLKKNSLDFFSLFLGPLGSPTRRLEDSSMVQASDKVCLQRWSLDLEKEEKDVRTDDMANHLLCSEALHYLETGRITPTEQERAQLDEYLDPEFPTERQFLELARNIPGYATMEARGCTLLSPVDHEGGTVPAQTRVTCSCTDTHLVLHVDKMQVKWLWRLVRKWSVLVDREMREARFEVCMTKGHIAVVDWFVISTPQAAYILQSAKEICFRLRDNSLSHEELMMEKMNQVEGKFVDPLYEMIHNDIYRPILFTSVAKK